jgi:hypothetical protein
MISSESKQDKLNTDDRARQGLRPRTWLGAYGTAVALALGLGPAASRAETPAASADSTPAPNAMVQRDVDRLAGKIEALARQQPKHAHRYSVTSQRGDILYFHKTATSRVSGSINYDLQVDYGTVDSKPVIDGVDIFEQTYTSGRASTALNLDELLDNSWNLTGDFTKERPARSYSIEADNKGDAASGVPHTRLLTRGAMESVFQQAEVLIHEAAVSQTNPSWFKDPFSSR